MVHDIKLLKHQSALINCVRMYPDISYLFLIGGFGAGKSFSDVALAAFLYDEYKDCPEPVTIGLFGVTIKLLRQTVIADLEKLFDQGGIPYKDNSQAGILKAGNVTFIYLAMQNPDDIYAYNFHCAICDEIDEIPADRVMSIVKAVQERCRKTMPESRHIKSRSPFICFTTTAQGLRGTYQLIKYFQNEKIGYIKIRARTQDNTSLDPKQLANLRALYTEDERKAFLDGEFVNLTTGRVYAMFNTAKHKYMSFPLKPSDIIYVGQDFNKGFNAAVVVVQRGDTLYAAAEYHWDYVGQAARLLREYYPENRIIMIPDASGKEIMSGFVEEFEEHGIEIFWNNVNPSITERITAINKAFWFNKLFVFPTCQKLLLGLETRDFNPNTGDPRKGQGKDALDHHCDAFEYAVWHIIHSINGFDRILEAIRAVNHNKEAMYA